MQAGAAFGCPIHQNRTTKTAKYNAAQRIGRFQTAITQRISVLPVWALAPRSVRVEAGQRLIAEFVEIAAINRSADVVKQLDEEMLVVNCSQRESVEFAGTQGMIHVGTRIVRAGIAGAALLKRPEIVFELRPFDVIAARTRENRAIAAATCRRHAIERVAAILNAREDVIDGGEIGRAHV